MLKQLLQAIIDRINPYKTGYLITTDYGIEDYTCSMLFKVDKNGTYIIKDIYYD